MSEPSAAWTANVTEAPCPHCGKVWLVTVNVAADDQQLDANQVKSLQQFADEKGLPAEIVDAVDAPVRCRPIVGGCGEQFRVIGLMAPIRQSLN